MYRIFILSLLLAFGYDNPGFGQCDPSQLAQSSIANLPDNFTFLKTFKIDGQGGQREKVEYSYVFSKDTNYALNIKSGGEDMDGIVVSMYDSNRKRVATNFVEGNFYGGIQYPCKATGIYYITFTFEDSKAYCGGSVLGFNR